MQWQPIETAPKDGTPIIGYQPERTPSIFEIWWQPNYILDDDGIWHGGWDDYYDLEHEPMYWKPINPPEDVE